MVYEGTKASEGSPTHPDGRLVAARYETEAAFVKALGIRDGPESTETPFNSMK